MASYTHDRYNYQVGVIFAILVGGLLLLALVVGAIYFICVNNMRDDEKKNRGGSSTRSDQRSFFPASQPVPPASTYNPPPQTYNESQYLTARSPIATPSPNLAAYNQAFAASGAPASYVPTGSYAPTSSYQQQPLVQPAGDFAPVTTASMYRPLQPEAVYQQGPTTWQTTTPVEYRPGPAFHTSSV